MARTVGKRATVNPRQDEKRPERSKRLSAAQMVARDSLIVQRVAQGWSWPAIAGEANLSISAAQRAHAARVREAPFRLGADPVKVVENIFTAYQLSIGDFEAIASAALEKNQLAVAVGAKKGANDAREKVVLLLQATGRLPQDLTALRHLIDIRAIAVRMLDAVDSLQREGELIAQIEDPAARRRAIDEATAKIRTTFAEVVGLDGEQQAIEGSARETDAAAS